MGINNKEIKIKDLKHEVNSLKDKLLKANLKNQALLDSNKDLISEFIEWINTETNYENIRWEEADDFIEHKYNNC